MDFLDPKKERQAHVNLLLGYGLVTIAIAAATLVLLYQAFGYNIDRQGEVTQNGLLFVSSQPDNATITLNGKPYKSNTNARVNIPAGSYTLGISKTGYRPWERPAVVAGDDVQRFDYPLLFPKTLKTSALTTLSADPTLATQSPDQRWLLLGQPAESGTFTQYDLRNPAKPVASEVALPAASFTAGTGSQTWTTLEWALDSRHVLLEHTYTLAGSANREYILLDRDTPADSVNLTHTLNLNQTETVNLFNQRTDQFYVYDANDQTLKRVNGDDASVASKLDHILAFKTYGDDKILYITDQSPTGKSTPGLVSAVLQDGQQTITLRTLPPAGDGSFVLSLGQYAGTLYAAIASSGDTAAYLYKNPQNQTTTGPDAYPAPWRRVLSSSVSALSFSGSMQFLSVESGQDFVVYDLENAAHYQYRAAQSMDQPQTQATWIDGSHLAYVSGGALEVFDYDYRNQQALMSANPAYLPFLSSDSTYLYTLRPVSADSKAALTSTPLVVK